MQHPECAPCSRAPKYLRSTARSLAAGAPVACVLALSACSPVVRYTDTGSSATPTVAPDDAGAGVADLDGTMLQGAEPTATADREPAPNGGAEEPEKELSLRGYVIPNGAPVALARAQMRAASGEMFSLADYDGRVVVVELWTTASRESREHLPKVAALAPEFKAGDRTVRADDVVFIGLCLERPTFVLDKVRAMARRVGPGYRIGFVSESDARRFAAQTGDGIAVPQTIILRIDGTIDSRGVGMTPDQIRRAIRDAEPVG